MQPEEKIAAERRCELAMARLGVAEDLRWHIAILLAFVMYLQWGTLIGAVAAFAAAVYFVPYKYNKEYESANGELERLTGTGKYYQYKAQESETTE